MDIFVEFTKPRKTKIAVFSWLIRLVQGTPYSHVLLRWVNSVGVELVYEASGRMLKFLGPKAHKDRYYVIRSYKIPVSRDEYRETIKLCMENAGVDYGLKQAFGIALVHIFKLKKNPFSDGQVCSEIVGHFIEQVKKQNTGLDLNIAGPKEIDEYLEGSNYELVKYNKSV